MLRAFVIFLLIMVAGVLLLNGIKEKVKRDLAQPFGIAAVSPTPAPQVKPITGSGNDRTSLFVPYWTLQNADFSGETYESYLYFGIAPGKNGINFSESGAGQLDTFLATVPPNKKKQLVLRMINSEQTFPILKDQARQKRLITQTLEIARENGFESVVLDLELSAIPFDSLVTQINGFVATFHTEAKKQNTSFAMTLYGDTFFRLRPFDVKSLSQNADNFFIMAYDFHKARGSNPGPNFPLSGKDRYGYDMATMSDDFLKHIPPEKLTVIFGLFGYDWEVDVKGTATSQGEALTYHEITNRFLTNCSYRNCTITRDPLSQETQIHYTAEDNTRHIVWFEDRESVEAKQAFLRGKGITSFSFWANSYF